MQIRGKLLWCKFRKNHTCDITTWTFSDTWHHSTFVSDASCGGVRTQSAGVISSSNFPNGYKNSSRCVWKIRVNSANQITLNFTDFDLEPDSRCNETYVRVHDGENVTDHVIATFCGNQTPSSVQSSGSKLLVIFYSLKGSQRKGFRAYYDSGMFGPLVM